MAKANSFMDDVVKKANSAFSKAIKGEKILHSNESIVSAGAKGFFNNALGSLEVGARVMGTGGHSKQGLGEALTRTFAKDADKLYDKTGKRIADKAANWDYGKIAASYMGVSTAARVATGGGLYKDKNGNSNIVGVPFI